MNLRDEQNEPQLQWWSRTKPLRVQDFMTIDKDYGRNPLEEQTPTNREKTSGHKKEFDWENRYLQ